ncbi:DUF3892 domain-containing protein [Paenibacillus sp. FSL H8-0034]|uniref:DUF3892 domain-containing protein n=1 Tax=Paenibacillus sp. FSL H8-0034 TaxID=2954671 RepID=UPI0030F7B1EA
MSDYTLNHDSLNHHVHSQGELHSHRVDHQMHHYNLFQDASWISGNESVLHHTDPLSVSHKFSMPPMKLHMVKPHLVNGYIREDGTDVKPYIRDGNGDGYLRSNPDGILSNNLDLLLGGR